MAEGGDALLYIPRDTPTLAYSVLGSGLVELKNPVLRIKIQTTRSGAKTSPMLKKIQEGGVQ